MKTVMMALLLSGILVAQVSAASTARQFVSDGLEAYRAYGARPMLKLWEYSLGDRDLISELDKQRGSLGGNFGSAILAERTAGPSYSVVYAVVYMNATPVFFRVTCYQPRGFWKATQIETRLEPWDFVPGFSTTGAVFIAPQGEGGAATARPAGSVDVRVGDTQSSSSE